MNRCCGFGRPKGLPIWYMLRQNWQYVEAKKIFQELEELRSDANVGEIRKKKINGVPVMDWLSQLLQKESAS